MEGLRGVDTYPCGPGAHTEPAHVCLMESPHLPSASSRSDNFATVENRTDLKTIIKDCSH